jgi:hypothetical protein
MPGEPPTAYGNANSTTCVTARSRGRPATCLAAAIRHNQPICAIAQLTAHVRFC